MLHFNGQQALKYYPMLIQGFYRDIFSKLNITEEELLMTDNVGCDIRQTLDRISSKMRRDYSESLRELNLYVGQDNLLARLWIGGDGITQMQLCEYLKCEPPTVTNMVRSLEQNDFIYRTRDKHDARVMRIFLTDKGKELEEPVNFKWKQQQEKLLHSILPADRLLLRQLLKQMESDLL